MNWITLELENSKKRPKSGDFLDGFPWKSVTWHKATLEYNEFENLYLFWSGSAWEKVRPPHKLKDGVMAFIQLDKDESHLANVHLIQIHDWLKRYEAGIVHSNQPFLILAGLHSNSRLIILDGNHRAAAALWWATQSGDSSKIPLSAWLGFSPNMGDYSYYQRILQAE
jgi:hypothetical protein